MSQNYLFLELEFQSDGIGIYFGSMSRIPNKTKAKKRRKRNNEYKNERGKEKSSQGKKSLSLLS